MIKNKNKSYNYIVLYYIIEFYLKNNSKYYKNISNIINEKIKRNEIFLLI